MKSIFKKVILVFVDAFIVVASWILAIFLSSRDFYNCMALGWHFILIAVVISIAGHYVFGVYNKMLRYIGPMDIARFLLAILRQI